MVLVFIKVTNIITLTLKHFFGYMSSLPSSIGVLKELWMSVKGCHNGIHYDSFHSFVVCMWTKIVAEMVFWQIFFVCKVNGLFFFFFFFFCSFCFFIVSF